MSELPKPVEKKPRSGYIILGVLATGLVVALARGAYYSGYDDGRGETRCTTETQVEEPLGFVLEETVGNGEAIELAAAKIAQHAESVYGFSINPHYLALEATAQESSEMGKDYDTTYPGEVLTAYVDSQNGNVNAVEIDRLIE